MGVKRYRGNGVEISYDPALCTHAAECVRRLPEVFDTSRRPWVLAAGAGPAAVVEVVARCPTGALRTERTDGGPGEVPDPEITVTEVADGPLHVRGTVRLVDADGTPFPMPPRVALCRCGASGNRPFCDGSHHRIAFRT